MPMFWRWVQLVSGDVGQRFSHDRISENERVKYERYGMRYV